MTNGEIPQQPAPQERPGRIEYLYLTEDQKRASDAMDNAIDNLPPFETLRCQSPQVKTVRGRKIAYYQHIDYDERTPPTEREADLMCKTAGKPCPVADLCLQLGTALHADTGVWGGRVLVDGEQYHTKKKAGGKHD